MLDQCAFFTFDFLRLMLELWLSLMLSVHFCESFQLQPVGTSCRRSRRKVQKAVMMSLVVAYCVSARGQLPGNTRPMARVLTCNRQAHVT